MDKKWYKRKGSNIKWSFKAKIILTLLTWWGNILILLCNIRKRIFIKEVDKGNHIIKLMKEYLNDIHFIKSNPCLMYYYEYAIDFQYETLES